MGFLHFETPEIVTHFFNIVENLKPIARPKNKLTSFDTIFFDTISSNQNDNSTRNNANTTSDYNNNSNNNPSITRNNDDAILDYNNNSYNNSSIIS
ncbi:24713_t:CDS:2 [Dentiscutata erythropus]|uniref:24713_t:CDS:1 n=1 Tax=Dentiscutata erythropus TaxID=1348616 RepID=A0A9N9FK88_9GLOM|nr:24713_t:CDS:2 [Dentiscutata erythropus]